MVQTTTDVLIIGAGPTGTTLALELAAHNIPFRLVDKALERSDKSRALAVQSRSLEVLNRHAPVQELIDLGNCGTGGVYYIHGKQVADLDLSKVRTGDDTEFPQTLMVPQSDTEHFLDQVLVKKYSRSPEFGVEAALIKQDAEGVTVTLRKVRNNNESSEKKAATAAGQDEVETVRAKYVVGADGSHSAVRHACPSITFDGSAYPQDFILCDARLRASSLPRDRFAVCWGAGLMTVFPLKDGLVRVVASRPDHHADDEDEPVLEDFQKWFDHMAPGSGELYDPFWMARFRLHHRVASSYREGRLFLAGDAAHIHSPAGGQGMNTGSKHFPHQISRIAKEVITNGSEIVQDAANLGWKLARVLRGEKPDALLDSYSAERRPVGEKLLKSSDLMFSIAAANGWLWRLFRNLLAPWLLPFVYHDEARRNTIFRFLSQLGVRYRRSAIVGTAAGFAERGPVRGGDRAPDGVLVGSRSGDGGRQEMRLHRLLTPEKHHLLLFSGVEEEGRATGAELMRAEAQFKQRDPDAALVHMLVTGASETHLGYLDVEGALHRRFGMEKTAGYAYVRPDGYVAHIGPLSSLGEFMEWQ
ncbi:FAD binding domain-containing protein [Apiospora marii]|uniref:FAD binding domain-containing protein n=1 Tax=Apiospora marii TaxID=335849 RepID=A0ABR1SBK5_9PEZI